MTYPDPKAVEEDRRLQADPGLSPGRPSTGRILLAVTAAIVIVVATFYGVMHSRNQTEQTASAPATSAPAGPPATKEEAKGQDQGQATQANQPGSSQPGAEQRAQQPSDQRRNPGIAGGAPAETTGAAPPQSAAPDRANQRGQQKK